MNLTSSPWGKIDGIEKFGTMDETYYAHTASHGGVMLPKLNALDLGIAQYGEDFESGGVVWSCFEEDCAISVAVLALALDGFFTVSNEQLEDLLISLAAWAPDYMEGLKLDGSSEITTRVLAKMDEKKDLLAKVSNDRKNRELSDKMRAEKSPQLIVSASSIRDYNELKKHLKTVPKLSGLVEREELQDIYVAIEKELELHQGTPEGIFHRGPVTLVWTANDDRYLVRNYEVRSPNLLTECEKIAQFNNY
jgi:hypothetical protein